jgi:hypothetical protein
VNGGSFLRLIFEGRCNMKQIPVGAYTVFITPGDEEKLREIIREEMEQALANSKAREESES